MTDIYFQVRAWLEGTYTLRILENAWDLLLKVGPYLLVSLAIGIMTSRLVTRKRLCFSSRSEVVSILLGAAIGLLSPLPTYAAIPVAISLMTGGGIPFSAVIAFVISSPLINPSIFFLTVTQLGLGMALARTVTAFALGALGGLSGMKIFRSLRVLPEKSLPVTVTEQRPLKDEILRTVRYAGKYFSIAILLSAAVKALIAPQAIVDLLGSDARMGTLVAIALGVPLYSCGGAAIPLMQTLMGMGMSKGAVLAFFVAGPATKVETLYAFKSLLGVRVLVFYLAITFVFALMSGLLYSLI
jgi:uncharacterized protein